jgi:hypothetical protein
MSLQDLQSQLNSLRDEVGALRQEVTRLNDIQAIRTLHFKYGYYWDNVLYEQVIDLFTDDVKVPPSPLSFLLRYSSTTVAGYTMVKKEPVESTKA